MAAALRTVTQNFVKLSDLTRKKIFCKIVFRLLLKIKIKWEHIGKVRAGRKMDRVLNVEKQVVTTVQVNLTTTKFWHNQLFLQRGVSKIMANSTWKIKYWASNQIARGTILLDYFSLKRGVQNLSKKATVLLHVNPCFLQLWSVISNLVVFFKENLTCQQTKYRHQN